MKRADLRHKVARPRRGALAAAGMTLFVWATAPLPASGEPVLGEATVRVRYRSTSVCEATLVYAVAATAETTIEHRLRVDQVQTFLPSPMATATAMYHTARNPLRRVGRTSETVRVPRGLRQRRLHKAFLRYHDPGNWPMLREALKRMGRSELIGRGPEHLVPPYQPRGSGRQPEGLRGARRKASPAGSGTGRARRRSGHA